jgi:splicing factor 3B subunit 1
VKPPSSPESSSEMQDSKRSQGEQRGSADRVTLTGNKGGAIYDTDIYGDSRADRSEYVVELDNSDEEEDTTSGTHRSSQVGPSRALIDDSIGMSKESGISAERREMFGSGLVNTRIADRESSYQQRRTQTKLSPSRGDAFDDSNTGMGYKDLMKIRDLEKEEDLVRKAIAKKLSGADGNVKEVVSSHAAADRRKRRWGDEEDADASLTNASGADNMAVSSSVSLTAASAAGTLSTRRKSRWDSAASLDQMLSNTDADAASADAQPTRTLEHAKSSLSANSAAPAPLQPQRWEADLTERNRPQTDAELDAMFPTSGYEVLEPPPGYQPAKSARSKLLGEPDEADAISEGFTLQPTPSRDSYGIQAAPSSEGGALPHIKPEDYQYFGKLLSTNVNAGQLSREELKERQIMTLLLKIKSGTPPQRKSALRQIADKAREFGPEALFDQILPLLSSPNLEDQERHLLVKVIDRVLYRLSDLIRPFVHKILQVIEPMLIDDDFYARVEGREIISNLSKAAGLACMISTMREDIDSSNEYVRNATARAFAVVASALGIPALLPFLKAVCQSQKSWEARHTGIKIVQQIAILTGAAILPHLRFMVSIVQHGLTDKQQKVRIMTAQTVAALAESSYPYGIEAFDGIIAPLWTGTRQHKQKELAAFLKAIGFVIPLMEEVHANHYTRHVMVVIVREFVNPDEDMKKIVLKVVQQCVATDGVDASYIRESILPEFFRNFWVRRMALDRRNYKQVVETTVELANRVGASDIISKIVEDLKDESAPYRNMVMETIESIIKNLGTADVETRLEEQLIDGVLFAFQEQQDNDSPIVLSGFGTVVNALGQRTKPYLPQICGTIKWRLNNKSATIRMQAADLTAKIAAVMKLCQEEQLMGHLGVVMYEYLGEEYPEVLGSILGALRAIVSVIGMTNMTPPIKDLLPRLTPILKNRHEKVQESCIELVGRIADRGAEYVSPREWIRICFELLDMLKAKKKSIRKAAVSTFGYIAKSVGPQDVLHTLLSNLKVQERQMRVCTTVAIAIVAETCSPFTILPGLMNEYRIPDTNVQNGVLKALSFMFEYIGEMGKDYLYAVSPLLIDALIDRDHVHRQTAATTVKHLALGAVGMGCEDALVHLLNYVWPNIFEESPHVINATMDAIEGMMVALGPARIMMYIVQGLFHPARKVRDVYWRIYNSLYIYAQDGMVAAYPRLENEENTSYRRTELELFI